MSNHQYQYTEGTGLGTWQAMKQTIDIDYNTFNTNTGGCRLNYCDMMYVTLFIIVKELSDDIRGLCNSYKKDLPGHSGPGYLIFN